MPAPKGAESPARIRINYPAPTVDGGRYPAKRCIGDTVTVSADIFRDGHEILRAVVRYKAPGSRRWVEVPMQPLDAHINGVRWQGEFTVETAGRWEWTIEAWSDQFATWRDELQRKVAAAQDDLAGEMSEGVVMLEDAAARARSGDDRATIEGALDAITGGASPQAALAPDLFEAMERVAERHGATRLPQNVAIDVDRVRARFSSWYELFPRSWGGLKGVEAQIPAIAELGFDVLYFPPIHPIGRKNRKGRNNALTAGPDDPGSPYAIGAAEGGHDAVHPELGTMDDMRSLCATAREHGMDVALDLALNASADHPWLTEHPEWFLQRPDGTIKYAENPPKKYQDIYNFNWDTPAWREMWEEWLRIMLVWVHAGVKVFRVDNPHTKPFPFWEWLIAEVHKVDRDVIFLAEAFTRRAVMRELAKLGFTQSYTYFTWKNSRWELTEYVNELAWGPEREYFRPNFFPVTPDILHAYLQHGGPPAFVARLVLAATLSPSYGIYSGYESFENSPVREGSEEYLNSEKYEVRERALDGPLLPMIRRINEIRQENPALQVLSNVFWLETQNDGLIAYAKQIPGNCVIAVVNIDPHTAQEGAVTIPAQLGLPPVFAVEDLLTGDHYDWRIGSNYVRLDPHGNQTHVFRVVT
ncbi:MAG TPA: alpha-1,4-glucan--maltose-1-phosphate maltosyltransferase [Solirubrobacteraceae bacterium]|nr:alpha-1,4-glucan--maltose-1-phosphate maltosyltransferase [Solirubrobacteraceae bacterium]